MSATARESKVAESMRLAACRLEDHAAESHRKAAILEQPSGLGENADRLRNGMAAEYRKAADIDAYHAKTLKTHIRKGDV